MGIWKNRNRKEPVNDSQPSQPDLKRPPYQSNHEYIKDELNRVAYFLLAYAIQWRADILGNLEGEAWGEIARDNIAQEQLKTLLDEDADLFGPTPDWAKRKIDKLLENSETKEQSIDAGRKDMASMQDLRLPCLMARFDLSRQHADILLLSLLAETDTRFQRVCAEVQSETSGILPSMHLLNRVLEIAYPNEPLHNTKLFEPLLRHRLISLHGGLGQASLVRVEAAVQDYLFGREVLDEQLSRVVIPIKPHRPDLILDPALEIRLQKLETWWAGIRDQQRKQSVERAQLWRQEEQRWLSRAVSSDGVPVAAPNVTMMLHGSYGSGRREVAERLCATAETPLLIVQVERALNSALGWDAVVELVYRDARMGEAAVCWVGCEALLSSQEPRMVQQWDTLATAAEHYPYMTFFTSEFLWQPVGRFMRTTTRDPLYLRLSFPPSTYDIRVAVWQSLLTELTHMPRNGFRCSPPEISAIARSLANSFQFTPGQIADAVRTAQAIAIERDPIERSIQEKDLYDGCRRQTGQRLISFARQIKPRADLRLDQLILPDNTRQQLVELQVRMQSLQRIYNLYQLEDRLTRGRGVVALFTGSSGTGKTTAAECLAGEMHVDLFKVDAGSVVSKYVGETEKHLDQVFREAEAANGVLFFDEADALFGKRGEVKEAQDRWANLEVNYLLQRIEDYTGVVILATNLSQNIDEAFRRRIHVIVDFPFPNEADRLRIWRQVFAGVANDLSDEDLGQVARFRLSGGNIRNIASDAIFRANPVHREIDQPMPVTLTHVVLSLAREYQKLGKPITPNEFSTVFFDWIQKHNIL